MIGGKLVVWPSAAFLVCTLILLRMRLMPSPSVSSRAGRAILPLLGGCETEPLWPGLHLPFVDPLLFEGLLRSRGATLKFYALKYGYSCLSRTSTRVTLSSLGSSSMGVSFILSKFRWRSFSDWRMPGVELSMSSRNSVSRRAARLYF